MQQRLDELRLRYHDTYPDIVILREQIKELKKQRDQAAEGGKPLPQASQAQSIANPVYQELSTQLASARTQIETIDTRIKSLKALLVEQKSRMERIQGNKQEYADLTRNMETNKQIYNDLLKRRETARMSMTLDVEGQGSRYRINETAQFPLKPTGLQFFQFAAVGLLLGLLAPFGAVAGLLQVDPRVRTRSQLESEAGIPVLIEIPHVRTPFEKRRNRKLTVAVIFCSLVAVAGYIAIAVASVMGVL
jgi:polysaccharide chain length determinant protein (PEP-CTERM system associated)